SGALHMALHPAHSPEFLAATGPAGTAVHQGGQRRSVTRRFLSVITIEHEETPVPGSQPADDFVSEVGSIGDYRSGQTALTAGGHSNGIARVPIPEHRADGAERFDIMRLARAFASSQEHG